MIRKLYTLAAFATLLLAATQAEAQGWRHYMLYNQSLYNPAMSGANADVVGAAIYNMQNVTMPGAPRTALIQANGRLGNSNASMGGGASYANYGVLNNYGGFLSFSYAIPLKKDRRLQFGMGANFNFLQENGSSLTTAMPGDDIYKVNTHSYQWNVSVGAAYVSRHFWAGFAVPKLLRNDYDYAQSRNRVRLAAFNFNLMAGANVKMGKDFHFLPSFLIRSDDQERFNCDINLNFKYKDVFWFGPYYRVNSSLGFMLGVGITKYLKISYAAEMMQTALTNENVRNATYGSHEIMLGFRIPKANRRVAQGPRYF